MDLIRQRKWKSIECEPPRNSRAKLTLLLTDGVLENQVLNASPSCEQRVEKGAMLGASSEKGQS